MQVLPQALSEVGEAGLAKQIKKKNEKYVCKCDINRRLNSISSCYQGHAHAQPTAVLVGFTTRLAFATVIIIRVATLAKRFFNLQNTFVIKIPLIYK